ncbi:AI-2E family transporter [Candidatus Sumerlaeota bacterium]|nr:AI-2E family transporter [Candidatus Sumerlaeota bacterium]
MSQPTAPKPSLVDRKSSGRSFTREQSWLITASCVVLAAVALAFGLHYTRQILIPFVLAAFAVSLVAPVHDQLVLKFKCPRMIGVAVAMLVVLVFLTVLTLLIATAVNQIVERVGAYTDDFTALARKGLERVNQMGFKVDQASILEDLRGSIPGMVRDTFGTMFSLAGRVVFVLVFTLFLLIGRNPKIIRSGIYAEVDRKIRKYIGIKFIASAVTGLLVWAALSAIGLELAFVFGVLAFLLNFIPSVGSIIAVLLPVPLAFAQFSTWPPIILVIVIPTAIQFTIGNVLEPQFLGEGLDIHPAVVLLALAIWGLLWGVVGALLSVPMTAIIKIILMQTKTLRPIGLAMEGKLPGYKDRNASGST